VEVPDALTNWTEWAAIAQFVAAGVLTVSAGALIASAVETRSLSKKTGTLSDHTKVLADQAQVDTEMRYRPYVVQSDTPQGNEESRHWQLFLRNAGVRPALAYSIGFVGEKGEFGQVRSLVLGPGETSVAHTVKTEAVDHPEGLFNPPPGLSVPGGSRNVAVVCTDVLGTRWRFLNGMTPEPWRADSNEPAPPWTAW
jgi:hypothetical protein